MTRYHCPKCDEHFFVETANMNQRHGCGEFAYLDWETGRVMDTASEAEEE